MLHPLFKNEAVKSLLALQNFIFAREGGKTFQAYSKLFFTQHSSEYETSDNDRKVNLNILPGADTRDVMNTAYSWPLD